MKKEDLKTKARLKNEQNKTARRDPRYIKVIGKFIAAGLLEHTRLPPYRGPVDLEEVLWAGKLEKKILELLPAVIMRRPSLIRTIDIPEDLQEAIRNLRHGGLRGDFRGVPLEKCAYWIERIGRSTTAPSVLKAFRFRPEDVSRLSALRRSTGLNETEVLRLALKKLASKALTK